MIILKTGKIINTKYVTYCLKNSEKDNWRVFFSGDVDDYIILSEEEYINFCSEVRYNNRNL